MNCKAIPAKARAGAKNVLTRVEIESPRMLGIGIDQDTAAVVHGDLFRAFGSGAVWLMHRE